MSSAAEIDADACGWVARLDRTLSIEDEEALARWLEIDPRHGGALLRAQACFAVLDRARALDPAAVVGPAIPAPGFDGSSRRQLLRLGGGGIAAALAGGLAWGVWRRPGERIATIRGEIRTLPLEDGTVAVVNSGSRLRARFAADRRQIDLADGEAFFNVAKDRHRPFIVAAASARIQAVGTAFNVRYHPDYVEVIVTEGIVRIWSEVADTTATTAGADLQVTVARDGRIAVATLSDARAADRLAWREGQIVLDEMALGEAAREFNRYNRRQLAIAPSLADKRIVGRFRTNDLDGFTRAVSTILNVRAKSDADVTVIEPI